MIGICQVAVIVAFDEDRLDFADSADVAVLVLVSVDIFAQVVLHVDDCIFIAANGERIAIVVGGCAQSVEHGVILIFAGRSVIGHDVRNELVVLVDSTDSLEQSIVQIASDVASLSTNGTDLLAGVQDAQTLSLVDEGAGIVAGEGVEGVAQGSDDHGQSFVSSNLLFGLEGAVGITSNETYGNCVADVTGCPVGSGNIAELGGSAALNGDTESVNDHGSHFCSGNYVSRLEVAIGIPADYAKSGQNVNCFCISLGVGDIGELSAEDKAEAAQDHSEGEYQRKYFLHS